MIDWQQIDTVFLDMDGTLLDLHFDNHFWLQHVPLRYAEKYQMPLEQAHEEVARRTKSVEGTLDWYCLDYWSRELGLDIPLLKEEVDHLIAVHPHVTEFLDAVRTAGKRMLLVTNAHMKALSLKMEKTQLGGHFDEVVCSHDYNAAKEEQAFWQRLQETKPFDPARTLLVDDSLAVLRSARRYGIGHLLAVYHPDTQQGRRDVEEFEAIESFLDIMPK